MRGIRWITLAFLIASTLACSTVPEDPNPVDDPEPKMREDQDLVPRDGEEALDWLMAGNHRFWDGHPRHSHESMRRAAMLQEAQHPFAVVLGCADSRVSPELLLDHGLGNLFVIRVAGNVVADDEAGSIEYAVLHLDVPLVLVLGHEGCGAVTAAMHASDDEPAELRTLIRRINPALNGIPPHLPEKEQIHLGVEANVRQSVRQLRRILAIAQASEKERPKKRTLVVGGVYELSTGRVRLLDR